MIIEFMKKLSDQASLHKKTSPLTNYLLPVTFCCHLFVLGNFDRFFYDYFFYWAFLLIIQSAFSLCTIFYAKLKWIDNNNNYNSNIHNEIINFEKTETTWDEYRL